MPEVLEQGRIAFAYRPRVEHPIVVGPADVQRLLLLLRPEGRALGRVVVVGRKRLPSAGQVHQRFWAYVERVATADRLSGELAEFTYETSTRGVRHQGTARLAGEGAYVLVRKDRHTDLEYLLDLPARRGDVQRALRIEREASYVMAVFNPEIPRLFRSWTQSPRFPPELQARFGDHHFAPAEPQLLDHPGAELVMIGGRSRLRGESPVYDLPRGECAPEKALEELGLPVTGAFLRPLIEGAWL